MKEDARKPKAMNFYWQGLSLLCESIYIEIIECFERFTHDVTLQNLQLLFCAVKKMISEYEDASDLIYQIFYVYEHGAIKYGDKNYSELCLERILHALGRHIAILAIGSPIDEDSDLHHLAHIMANVLIAAELLHRNQMITAL